MQGEATPVCQLLCWLMAGGWVLLGVEIYLIALNRLLNYLQDGAYKVPLLVSTFIVFLVVLVGVSTRLDPGLSSRLLVGSFALLCLGELRLLWIRRQCAGSSPVAQYGPELDWRRPVTTTDLQIVHYQAHLPGWRGRAFRIVHLSDFHLSEKLPFTYFESVVQQVNQAQADLLFITGDFVTGTGFIERLPGLLQGLHSHYGVYGILGNHDYWSDPARVKDAARRGGVLMIGTEGQPVDLGDGQMIWLVGCDAPWSGERRAELCRNWSCAVQTGNCVLGLSHSADYIYPLSRSGVKAVFSGHYHAGQFQLPGLGPALVPSCYGRLFYRGHFVVNGTHLFVSSGIGCAEPALRLYCPPELLVVDFSSEKFDPGKLEQPLQYSSAK